MLKALELVGFKSFADKTRFEFPTGITSVVGPNGSGKSNIVDGVKWVLGEQSAKSLRGKEMADVIFNGADGRRPVNTAEVTLTFDNSESILAVDTPEVHITRRVYRSGEGEYLINRQACRLRDIRDLFAGTGVAQHAYSIIEQGKVSALLEASKTDRRMIFEEAAGISRFRAKKVETQRRLERVEQNLLRLADIVEEVENRVRSVRQQANKAQRYREYAGRLQELRTQVGLADWREMTGQLEALEAQLAEVNGQINQRSVEADQVSARAAELEAEITQVGELVRVGEARIAANRERIAANLSTLQHERSRSDEFESELEQHRVQIARLEVRASELQREYGETKTGLATEEAAHIERVQQLTDRQQTLAELAEQEQQVEREIERHRAAHLEAMRKATGLSNEMSALDSQLTAAEESQQRCEQRLAALTTTAREASEQLAELNHRERQLSHDAQLAQDELHRAQYELQQSESRRASRRDELIQLQRRHSAASERAALLGELEQRLEGVDAGVKEVLVAARSGQAGPFQGVRGLVADLFQAPVDTAALVEVALGEKAGYLVVDGAQQLYDHLSDGHVKFSGRVGFVPLESREASAAPKPNLENRRGVVARVDRCVETAAEYKPLARRLLGDVWIVQTLDDAVAILEEGVAGVTLVTLSGELLRDDGTLVVGPRHTATGLISRRSELRALKQQVDDLARRIEQCEAELADMAGAMSEQEQVVETAAAAHQQAADELGEHRIAVRTAKGRVEELDRQRRVLIAESNAAMQQHESTVASLARIQVDMQSAEAKLSEAEAAIAGLRSQRDELAGQRRQQEEELTTAKVETAKSEERVENLRSHADQLQHHLHERRRALTERGQQLEQTRERATRSNWAQLRISSELAELYLRKDQLAADVDHQLERRQQLRCEHNDVQKELAKVQKAIRGLESKCHEHELAASQLRLNRDALVVRLRDDYGIDLSTMEEEEPDEEERQRREEVDAEIADLRRKIENLGNVNLDALEELDELDARFQSLSAQHQDLVAAKESLCKIIDKIDADSRELFNQTLKIVAEQFRELFRKLFGGGNGKIVLEEGVDVLESGIDIVACPPGKEPRNISLLSGGEKTLTCVALLLAIFRSRPSPFCILDEVDAALDEANIERFTGVLKEFVQWTQFIVVTHSKKTMACADTLYGVTMQESGVSKRVSVKFDDVTEDGHIRVDSSGEEAA